MRIRTADLLNAIEALYQLSYSPVFLFRLETYEQCSKLSMEHLQRSCIIVDPKPVERIFRPVRFSKV